MQTYFNGCTYRLSDVVELHGNYLKSLVYGDQWEKKDFLILWAESLSASGSKNQKID